MKLGANPLATTKGDPLSQSVNRPPSILLVESSREDASLFRIAMAEANSAIQVEVVKTSVEAFALLQRSAAQVPVSRPDVIVVCGGTLTTRAREQVRRFNADPSTSSIGVAVLTGMEDPAEHEDIQDLGVVAYWQKPHEWEGYGLIAKELDCYLYARAFSEGRTPPRGSRVLE